MESLSRPFHRRKLSNANSFSGKNAYDGVFSGHRPKFDGVPVVNVEEYREIFSSSQAASSIPVLDLSTLQESSDGSNLELGSTNPDYGKIFGGFRDEDIAVSYEELIARDKASSEDVGSEALKQYNMSYHKISQRNKDGLDVTTHVTKLHAVPGFTCFIDESASQQPKKETKIQKSSIPNDVQKETSQTPVESHNSKVSSINTEAASQPKMETEKKKSSETDKLESKSKYHQVESLSGDKKVDLESHNSNVSSSPATNGEPNKETDKKKSSETDNVDPINSRNGDFPEIKTSQSAVESKSKYHQDDKQTDLKSHNSKVSSTTNGEPTSQSKKETDKKKLSDDSLEKQTAQRVDRISKNFVADINIPPATSATNVDDNHEDDEKRSNPTSTWTWKTDNKHGTWFDEEVDVNSAAGASAAALRKAIEKAQESIRIAKESVGRKKEGLKSFSTKSFKDSLKVKKARVENVRTGEEEEEEQKVKDSWIQEFFKARVASVKTPQVSESTDGENEINRNILESEKKSEMVKGCCHELKDNCDDKDETKGVEYATRSPEEVENNTNESLEKDKQRPNGLFVIGSCENKVRDSEDTIKDEVGPSNGYKMIEETNNLTLYEKVEDEKKVSHDCDENGYEKRLGLLENIKQDVVEHEGNEEVVASDDEESEKVFEEEREVKEDSEEEEEEEKEEEEEEEDMKFYDVCEVEIIENSSSDYDDAEESDIIHVANRIEIDTQEVNDVDQKVELSEEVDDISKVDQSDNNTESSQEVDDVSKVDQSDNNVESSEEVDDVSISLPQVTVEEKEILETIQTGSINNEDKCEEMSDDELSSCDLADMESSSDTIHGMEIEVKEYKESIKKQEESNLQESHSERPEIIFEMETGTSKDMNDEAKEHEANKVMEKKERERERERERLAVERVIREARERSFNEVREKVAIERQRVMADVEKANSMKASDIINSRIKAERAAVERATAEARQRALEKAMSQNKVSEANDVRQPSSSDLHVSNGTSVESALRSKAKLEKHNRIMERAAKALAEKEKRDQLAQKEQAERNRLSENLDADIKRWSTGKEGNLRALLSTLQYILGPESGWQSVSLTEIITTTAVKKAYRKATLCVHPDKLQQRGASIQQKYICEKVFDLLKAAWNKFNSEER